MTHVVDNVSIQNREVSRRLDRIGKVILVGSGKGGVGKSFVASGLALQLSRSGFRTGILDLDIHGASIPNYLGVKPPLKSGKGGLEPKRSGKLKVMSVALLTGNNAVPMRGRRKQDLILQLFSITNWGDLDYLIVDLPPGTGDEVLSSFELFSSKCALLLVTTPSPNAMSIVLRLASLARIERIAVLGTVVNMAYLKIGKKTIFPFGRTNDELLEKKLRCKVIARFPLEARVNSGLRVVLNGRNEISPAMKELARKMAIRGQPEYEA